MTDRHLSISAEAYRHRIKAGWNPEKAAKVPIEKRSVPTFDHLEAHPTVGRSAFYQRIKNGWTINQAQKIPLGGKRKYYDV